MRAPVVVALALLAPIGWALGCIDPPAMTPPGTPADQFTATKQDENGYPSVLGACITDADCAVYDRETKDDPARNTFMCCPTCLVRAASRSWVASFERTCASRAHPTCPAVSCPYPERRTVCAAGFCNILKDDSRFNAWDASPEMPIPRP